MFSDTIDAIAKLGHDILGVAEELTPLALRGNQVDGSGSKLLRIAGLSLAKVLHGGQLKLFQPLTPRLVFLSNNLHLRRN